MPNQKFTQPAPARHNADDVCESQANSLPAMNDPDQKFTEPRANDITHTTEPWIKQVYDAEIQPEPNRPYVLQVFDDEHERLDGALRQAWFEFFRKWSGRIESEYLAEPQAPTTGPAAQPLAPLSPTSE